MIGLDTNILVHATLIQDKRKHERAKQFLEELVREDNYMISLQVIGEYYAVIAKLAPQLMKEAVELIETLADKEKLVHYTLDHLNEAIEKSGKGKFWDTLLAISYMAYGASAIATENEKDFKGIINTINPFK